MSLAFIACAPSMLRAGIVFGGVCLSVRTKSQQEVKVIWQRLHRMTPHTLHARHQELNNRQTGGQTDNTANVGNNSQHLMHSTQPKILVGN